MTSGSRPRDPPRRRARTEVSEGKAASKTGARTSVIFRDAGALQISLRPRHDELGHVPRCGVPCASSSAGRLLPHGPADVSPDDDRAADGEGSEQDHARS